MSSTIPAKLITSLSRADLAERCGISVDRLDRLLRNVGITSRRTDVGYLIFVADIEARLPELWASILLCEEVREAALNAQDL